jgi:WD40 repeat protein
MRRIVRIHKDRVHSIATEPGGNGAAPRFASASWDGTVKIYDLRDCHDWNGQRRNEGQVWKSLGEHKSRWNHFVKGRGHQHQDKSKVYMNGLYAVAFAKTSHDVLGCVSGADDRGVVHLWNWQTEQRTHQLHGHEEDANAIDFHPTQHIMATASDDRTAKIWDFAEGKELRTLDQHEEAVYGSIFLGPEMEYSLATCSFDKHVRIFDMRDESVQQEMQHHHEDIIGITFSDQKRLLATGGDDGFINMYDFRQTTSTGPWPLLKQINTRLDHIDCEVKRINFDKTGDMLAAACSTGDVLVYDLSKMDSDGAPHVKEVARLGGHEECCFDVAWTSTIKNGKEKRVLVSASHDATTRVWTELDPGEAPPKPSEEQIARQRRQEESLRRLQEQRRAASPAQEDIEFNSKAPEETREEMWGRALAPLSAMRAE